MKNHIDNKIYHVEVLPTKHNVEDIEAGLVQFADKYNQVAEKGYCCCITDNAMGLMAFQGSELISELELPVEREKVMIHLNTFHEKKELDTILDTNQQLGIQYYLLVTGDGNDRIHKLEPAEIGAEGAKVVTSVELMNYVKKTHPEAVFGCAFNPYEPENAEFEKLERKIAAGASFIITQPIIDHNEVVDRLLEKYPDIPVFLGAWMSKKVGLLSNVVGQDLSQITDFDSLATLERLIAMYPNCGWYLSLLGFKTQIDKIDQLWK